MATKKIILTENDKGLVSCTIDSNNLNVKISRANDLLNDISDVDLVLMDDKKQAKDLAKLKKLMAAAAALSEEISARFYEGQRNYYNQF